jgi:hypothetical protein
VDLVDLPGGPGQVSFIHPRCHFVLFGLREEPTEPQRLREKSESRFERALVLGGCQRDLPGEPRSDVVMASNSEGVEAQRLLTFADHGDNDRRALDTVDLTATQLSVWVEHYVEMRTSIDLVPSAAFLGHGLLHPPRLVVF